jgi:hypothetical protein
MSQVREKMLSTARRRKDLKSIIQYGDRRHLEILLKMAHEDTASDRITPHWIKHAPLAVLQTQIKADVMLLTDRQLEQFAGNAIRRRRVNEIKEKVKYQHAQKNRVSENEEKHDEHFQSDDQRVNEMVGVLTQEQTRAAEDYEKVVVHFRFPSCTSCRYHPSSHSSESETRIPGRVLKYTAGQELQVILLDHVDISYWDYSAATGLGIDSIVRVPANTIILLLYQAHCDVYQANLSLGIRTACDHFECCFLLNVKC